MEDRPGCAPRRRADRRTRGAGPPSADTAAHPPGRQRRVRAVHRGAGRRAHRPAPPRERRSRAQRRAWLRRRLRDLPRRAGRTGRVRPRRAGLRGGPAAAGRAGVARPLAGSLPAPAGGRVPGPHPGIPAAAAAAGFARSEHLRRGRRRSDHLRLRRRRPQVPAGVRAAVPRRRRGRPGGLLSLPARGGQGGRAPAGQQPAAAPQDGAGRLGQERRSTLSCHAERRSRARRRRRRSIPDPAGARCGVGGEGRRCGDGLAGRRRRGLRHRRAGAGQLDAPAGVGGAKRGRRERPLPARHLAVAPQPAAGRAGVDAPGASAQLDGFPRPDRGGPAARPQDQSTLPRSPGRHSGDVVDAARRAREKAERAAAGLLGRLRGRRSLCVAARGRRLRLPHARGVSDERGRAGPRRRRSRFRAHPARPGKPHRRPVGPAAGRRRLLRPGDLRQPTREPAAANHPGRRRGPPHQHPPGQGPGVGPCAGLRRRRVAHATPACDRPRGGAPGAARGGHPSPPAGRGAG